ncbi:MAG: ABC transporter ATP-binding protein [Actinomycetota bacterium]|nr:MAG: ABC transporter ATP-binding protein [Actinomycetota bacterium]
MTDGPAVRVTGLVKSYGDREVLRGLSFTAPRGAVTALLGPNGAGKSTAIEVCVGLRRADAGSVSVLDRDPQHDGAQLRPRVGMMLQAGGIPSGARAAEFVGHVASLYADPLAAGPLLRVLELDRLGRTTFRRMSGGEQARLRLACAIVGRPELVFLDEPTAGLDPEGRDLVWELVLALRAAGVSVVLCTHHLDEAERLADHVVIVDGGVTAATGATAELTGAAATDSLSFRAGAHLDVAGLERALPAGHAVRETAVGSYRVDGHVDPQTLAAVTAWCAQHGVMAADLRIGRRSLEDVYRAATGGTLP